MCDRPFSLVNLAMFVLQSGRYIPAKMEYSYGRRAQAVTYSLHWKDVAVIDTESLELAIAESESAIKDWASQGFKAERWRLEGRGSQVQQNHELYL